ncbi:MAG TPA: glycosyltransferase family 4 protein [Pyrinomonadaceae bacterium]|nr:glycosyltransferase family 4 protein [Pyrinomonadaceae bacterium]
MQARMRFESKGRNSLEQRRQICLIGTYPPRECGIATFTCDLQESLGDKEQGIQANVVAVTGVADKFQYADEVTFEIRQNHLTDYRLAAEYINFSGADVISLQHEFGIFGGSDGRYIFELLANLRAPVVTTLHTVIPEPPPGLRNSLIRIADLCDHLVVMNSKALPILQDVYGISRKVSVIHHGVPDVPFIDPNYYKDHFGVEGRLALLTFGLLNRNKGIEVMLEALPEVVARYPEVVYIILGATHPEVKRRQGEEYRLFLRRLVRELDLEQHVIFHDRYVNLNELCEFIGACDIYVTPYQSKDQIVSGTLAYAIGMGKAVVSTPYLYASELLADGRGRLVDFGDSKGLARNLIDIIENEAERHQMRKRAYEFGREMTWSQVGRRYQELFERVIASSGSRSGPKWLSTSGTLVLPEIKLNHLALLTDDTGIIQHATYGIPNLRSGYTTDDVARALVVVLMHYQQFADETALPLAAKYLSFLQYAQMPDGRFHNFMNYERRFTDEVGSEDTQGRALWGLGTAVAYGPTEPARALARELFEKCPKRLKLSHPRALAYAICGHYAFLQKYDGAARVRRKLEVLALRLADWYERSRTEEWKWFGEDMTYANARMPQAMLLAAEISGEDRFLRIGLESLDFLLSQTLREGQFDFPGNRGWLRRKGPRATFGQQPIEAGYMAEALMTAAELTREARYLKLANAAIEWLLGRNRLGVPLYDLATGACADGLESRGPSMNQGAESGICCLLGLLSVSRQSEKKSQPENESLTVASASAS